MTSFEYVMVLVSIVVALAIAHLLTALGDRGAEICAGARHGFIFPERFCHDRDTAERVWAQWFAMLERNLH